MVRGQVGWRDNCIRYCTPEVQETMNRCPDERKRGESIVGSPVITPSCHQNKGRHTAAMVYPDRPTGRWTQTHKFVGRTKPDALCAIWFVPCLHASQPCVITHETNQWDESAPPSWPHRAAGAGSGTAARSGRRLPGGTPPGRRHRPPPPAVAAGGAGRLPGWKRQTGRECNWGGG